MVFLLLNLNSVHGEPIVAGPLELTPVNATLIMKASQNTNPPFVSLQPTVKFSIKNKSSSDIKIIIVSVNLDAYDNLNQQLFPRLENVEASGVSLSDQYAKGAEIFIKDKSKFVTISPNQQLQVYIGLRRGRENSSVRVEDPSGDFYSTHRPSSMILNGAIGIINVDGSTDVRAFSFPDIPISLSMR